MTRTLLQEEADEEEGKGKANLLVITVLSVIYLTMSLLAPPAGAGR